MKWTVIVGAAMALVAVTADAQVVTEFGGIPSHKISEGGIERIPETLPRERAINLAVVISKIDGKYYWASRENKPLVRYHSGSFITYTAVDGSGYVRVIPPDEKVIASSMSDTEDHFDYVEHLVIGLRSVTYYGVRR